MLELGRPQEADTGSPRPSNTPSRLGDRRATMFTLARLARVGAEMGESKRAGLIWGAIEAEESRATHGNWEQVRDDLAAPVLAHAGDRGSRADASKDTASRSTRRSSKRSR